MGESRPAPRAKPASTMTDQAPTAEIVTPSGDEIA
jgi:hypothetical protein